MRPDILKALMEMQPQKADMSANGAATLSFSDGTTFSTYGDRPNYAKEYKKTPMPDPYPQTGEIWQHTKTRSKYRIEGTAFNTITDAVDVIYSPMEQAEYNTFTRQLDGHSKAFLSWNEDGSPRFVKFEAEVSA